MQRKKVFIISLNQLTTDFWKELLDLNHARLWHWKTPEHGINNLTTVWPDVIIIDGYWAQDAYVSYLRKVLAFNSDTNIFCLTPLSKSSVESFFIDQRLHVSKLDKEVIELINEAIQPAQKNNSFKQIA